MKDWSSDDAPASLQDLWSWVPPALYESLTDGEGGIFIMPAESTSSSSTEAKPVLTPALFPEITDLLRTKGFGHSRRRRERGQGALRGCRR